MEKFMYFRAKYNLANWILMIFFIICICIDIAAGNYLSACCNGFVAVFNMFLILVIYERRIMDEQEKQREREEEIIEMLNNKSSV